MLTATVLALVAAVLHAAWNLSVKQSVGDRFIALWGQFFVAGVLGSIALVAGGGIPARGFVWAALSGLAHLPYCLLLAKAYGVYGTGPITNPNDLGPALKRAIEVVKRGEPALVDVVTQAR